MDRLVVTREEKILVVRPGDEARMEVTRAGSTIEFMRSGIPGRKGDKGDTGLAGDPFVHTQASLSTEWIVNHNYGRIPGSVRVLSVGGVEMIAEVVDLTLNQLRVYFSTPVAGSAIVF